MLRLSEAIRLGSMLHPQGFGAFRSHGRSCALGAAEDAGFVMTSTEAILTSVQPCPHDCCMSSTVFGAIIHLNDYHGWTREAIADWVETVEVKLAETETKELALV